MVLMGFLKNRKSTLENKLQMFWVI